MQHRICSAFRNMAELVNRIDPAITFPNGETFNILQIPKSNSALVKDHEDSILTGVDLYSSGE